MPDVGATQRVRALVHLPQHADRESHALAGDPQQLGGDRLEVRGFREHARDRVLHVETLLCFPAGTKVGAPIARFLERARDCEREALRAILQHVVGRAALHRLHGAVFPDGAGDEDERKVGRAFPRQAERREAVEGGRHAEIGKDEIGPELPQRPLESRAGIHSQRLELQAGAAQFALAQLGVSRRILEYQDAQTPICHYLHRQLSSGHLPGERHPIPSRIPRAPLPDSNWELRSNDSFILSISGAASRNFLHRLVSQKMRRPVVRLSDNIPKTAWLPIPEAGRRYEAAGKSCKSSHAKAPYDRAIESLVGRRRGIRC